jgi:hypothetical protein
VNSAAPEEQLALPAVVAREDSEWGQKVSVPLPAVAAAVVAAAVAESAFRPPEEILEQKAAGLVGRAARCTAVQILL